MELCSELRFPLADVEPRRFFGIEVWKRKWAEGSWLEQEPDGSVKSWCWRSLGAEDAVGSQIWKVLPGLDGSPEPEMSEVLRDPRC